MDNLEQLLVSINKRKYNQANNPLKSHGPDHHWRVYKNALQLAQTLNTKYDPEILAAATLLHDMAAYYPDRVGENYHDFDHKIAKDVLEEIDFPSNKTSAVLTAIANHGSSPKYKSNQESIETTLLRDADKIDSFGPIGISRIIMVRTLKGDTLSDIVHDFYTKNHLKHKWESITTEEAKKIAKQDYEYSMKFFRNLASKL